jgi:hypothetical protein
MKYIIFLFEVRVRADMGVSVWAANRMFSPRAILENLQHHPLGQQTLQSNRHWIVHDVLITTEKFDRRILINNKLESVGIV